MARTAKTNGESGTEKPKKAGSFDIDALRKAAAQMSSVTVKGKTDLDTLSLVELYSLRQEVDAKLPAKSLMDMNLEEELVLQYQLGKAVQQEVFDDTVFKMPQKDKAQLLKMTTVTLESLIKLQNSVYNSERIKALELALGYAFKGVDKAVIAAFYAKYKETVSETAKK